MKIYVGTYGKYNAGSIQGAWLDLSDYTDRDAFYEACAELHSDEEDPEFMFQDWEDIPSDMVSESGISPECWELLEAYEEFDEGAVNAYCYLFGEWNKDEFQDNYHGEYDSWEAMAEAWLEDTGELNEIPERLRNYFDYQAYARDIRLSGEMCEHNGHFFWNC